MKNKKASVFLRYEFSDESGKLEGGDVFEFSTMSQVQGLIQQIVDVAHGDQVAVHLTIGTEKPFYGMLGQVGLTREDIEREMVDPDLAPPATQKKKASGKKKKAAKAKKK